MTKCDYCNKKATKFTQIFSNGKFWICEDCWETTNDYDEPKRIKKPKKKPKAKPKPKKQNEKDDTTVRGRKLWI